MRKWLGIVLVGFLLAPALAVNVANIDDIFTITNKLQQDTRNLLIFAVQLRQLKTDNFELPIAGSTQTVTITNAQKQKLLEHYLDLKQAIQDGANSLP